MVASRPSRRARRAKARPARGSPTGPSIWRKKKVPTSVHHRHSSSQAGPSTAARRASPSAVRCGSEWHTAATSGDTAAATGAEKCAHCTDRSSPSSDSTGEQCSKP